MAPKVKGVIFDMDGLMFDTERIWDQFWSPCCRKMSLPDPPPEFYSNGRGLAGEHQLPSIAGYYGGKLDKVIMRIMDVFLAIPSMLLAIAIVAAFGTSLVNVLLAIGISYVPTFARTVRAPILTVKGQEYIEAAKAVGASDFRIIFKYILPNSMAPIIVQVTLGVAGAILSIAGLSFLGLGIQPPTPEWGAMLSGARSYIRSSWHITVIPGLAIMLTILALNVMGDGLRDALDPRLKN